MQSQLVPAFEIKMRSRIILLYLVFLGSSTIGQAAVNLTIDSLKAVVKNDHAELHFNADSSLSSLHVQGKRLASNAERTFYLDWNRGVYGVFKPSSIHVVEQNEKRVHFYWLQENIDHVFTIELHYIMEDGYPGIYSYAKYTNDKDYNVSLGETRIVYRFDNSVLIQGTNKERTGVIPNKDDFKNCTSVQDSTCRFPNGTVYTKYDYATYIRKTNYQGVYGNGYGAFIISPSREYHGGGPLKQDLTVHQLCLVANYFVSGHFGTPGLHSQPGWKHIFGPFLIYFPTADSDEAIMAAVEKQIVAEQKRWPYDFVKDEEYPLVRGTVSGTVSGQTNATVVLWDSLDEEFDLQQLGYLYTVDTDSNGNYVINNVRPGTYRIAAYPIAGNGSDSLDESTVSVAAGSHEIVNFTLNEPQNIMWSIGEANRLSSEFKYSDQPRNYKWEWLPPTKLNFTIGESDPKKDWYYAQSRPGHWYIRYHDKRDGKSRTLRIALAAASQKTHLIVVVNGHRLKNYYFDNDSAIYRSGMRSGKYHFQMFNFTSPYVNNGENTIELWTSLGQIMYDAISLQRG